MLTSTARLAGQRRLDRQRQRRIETVRAGVEKGTLALLAALAKGKCSVLGVGRQRRRRHGAGWALDGSAAGLPVLQHEPPGAAEGLALVVALQRLLLLLARLDVFWNGWCGRGLPLSVCSSCRLEHRCKMCPNEG